MEVRSGGESSAEVICRSWNPVQFRLILLLINSGTEELRVICGLVRVGGSGDVYSPERAPGSGETPPQIETNISDPSAIRTGWQVDTKILVVGIKLTR